MNEVSQISEFGKIFIFLIAGFLLVAITMFLNKVLAPHKPNAEKLTSYECGEEPVGSAWMPFNTRFYIIALIFLLFDVEMVFIFPWATVYSDAKLIAADARWGVFTLIEMFVFAGILILGLVYVWCKGDLEYIKPRQILPVTDVKIPQSLYDKLNLEQSSYAVRTFATEQQAVPEPVAAPVQAAADAVKKPMFKPNFKKPSA